MKHFIILFIKCLSFKKKWVGVLVESIKELARN